MFPASLAARHSHVTYVASKLEGKNCLEVSGKDFPPWLLFFRPGKQWSEIMTVGATAAILEP